MTAPASRALSLSKGGEPLRIGILGAARITAEGIVEPARSPEPDLPLLLVAEAGPGQGDEHRPGAAHPRHQQALEANAVRHSTDGI